MLFHDFALSRTAVLGNRERLQERLIFWGVANGKCGSYVKESIQII